MRMRLLLLHSNCNNSNWCKQCTNLRCRIHNHSSTCQHRRILGNHRILFCQWQFGTVLYSHHILNTLTCLLQHLHNRSNNCCMMNRLHSNTGLLNTQYIVLAPCRLRRFPMVDNQPSSGTYIQCHLLCNLTPIQNS